MGHLPSAPGPGTRQKDGVRCRSHDNAWSILAKLGDFRGESRFTTWAYLFVILEVSAKLGRLYWPNPPVALDAAQWDLLPDQLDLDWRGMRRRRASSLRCAGWWMRG
jgi:RNA polymerase sigma-70 factor (ECF subfamily)